MFNWEDGTLVKGAYVVINGVEYPVVMPEYSGNTPLTAENLNKMQKELFDDSGWKTATLTSDFKPYGDGAANTPRYRKIGKLVQLVGTIAPTAVITDSNVAKKIHSIETGYRPSRQLTFPCIGSNKNTWLLTITTGGSVNFSRYGTTEISSVPTTAWLPFNVNFMVD